jgi:hypothetical protein
VERAGLILASDEEAKCVDLLSGTGLGGKTTSILSVEPGNCTSSGGELVGELILSDNPLKKKSPSLEATIYCCEPPLP